MPMRTRTECNTNETHWAKARRARSQRDVVLLMMGHLLLPALPVKVMLTRCGPRPMDAHDNLPSSCKHIVDEIAEMYGVPDNDPQIKWEYAQVKRKEFGVIVRIESC